MALGTTYENMAGVVYLSIAVFGLSILHHKAWRKEKEGLEEDMIRKLQCSKCGSNTVVRPPRAQKKSWLPVWMRGRREEDLEGGEQETLIRTPSESEPEDLGYGSIEEEAKVVQGMGQKVRRKGSKRVIGEEWVQTMEGNSKGKAKADSDEDVYETH